MTGRSRAASDTPARITLRPGGVGREHAAWLAGAGVAVALIARTGDDARGDVALRGSTASTCTSRATRERPTGTCIVLVAPGGERTMLPDPGANDRARAADLPDDCSRRAASCTSPATRCCAPARAAPRCARWRAPASAGMPVSVDPASAALLRDDPRSWTARGRSTCCCPTRTSSPRSARRSAACASAAVQARVARGARWSDGVRTSRAPPRLDDVRRHHRAGDAFAAGFLSAWPGPPRGGAGGRRAARRAGRGLRVGAPAALD